MAREALIERCASRLAVEQFKLIDSVSNWPIIPVGCYHHEKQLILLDMVESSVKNAVRRNK